MFYLDKLKVDKHYLIKDSIELQFNQWTNYFIGKNGTGKTTLLEIIGSFLSLDFNFISNKYESDITAFFKGTSTNLSVKVNYKESKPDVNIRQFLGQISNLESINTNDKILEISIIEDDIAASVYISKEKCYLITNESEPYKFDYTSSINETVRRLIGTLYSDHIEARSLVKHVLYRFFDNSQLTRFTEGIEYEKNFFEKKIVIELDNEDHIKTYGIRDEIFNPNSIGQNGLYKIIKKLKSEFILGNEYIENLIFSVADSTVLQKIADFLNVKNIRINCYISDISIEDGNLKFSLSPLKSTIVLKNNSIIQYDELSYGERRLFQIIRYIESGDFSLLDEPVNGLHHDFIDNIINFLEEKNQQSFIANQNPVLFDYIEVQDNKDFINKLVFCKLNENGKMSWTNPTNKEAEEFMENYETNFLSVSSILKKIELW